MNQFGPKVKVVVGLGNPGAKYLGTRHNVGFDVLECLSQKFRLSPPKAKFDGQYSTLVTNTTQLLLVWPMTYMNESGRCVKAITQFYKVDVKIDLMVVCDDLSLPLGKLRLRAKGSAGGQKGLSHILNVLGTQEIPRLRIGIDAAPPQWNVADYVLGKFRKDELEVVRHAVVDAADAVIDWCEHDLAYSMNQYNKST